MNPKTNKTTGQDATSGQSHAGYKFERLKAWQKAMDFCVKTYEVTSRFPRSEVYGLISQFRRASVSIPLNVAEGCGSGSDREFSRFLSVAIRSQYEVVTIIRLALRLGYLTPDEARSLETQCSEVGKLIQGLKNSLSED